MSKAYYTSNEKYKMLDYIISHSKYYDLKGTVLWKEMARERVCDRTWQSMKEHFNKYVITALNTFNIADVEKERIYNGYHHATRRCITQSSPPECRRKLLEFSSDEDEPAAHSKPQPEDVLVISDSDDSRTPSPKSLTSNCIEHSSDIDGVEIVENTVTRKDKTGLKIDKRKRRTSKRLLSSSESEQEQTEIDNNITMIQNPGRPFAPDEDKKIINFFLEDMDRLSEIRNNYIYRELQMKHDLCRFTESIKRRFVHEILPNLHKYSWLSLDQMIRICDGANMDIPQQLQDMINKQLEKQNNNNKVPNTTNNEHISQRSESDASRTPSPDNITQPTANHQLKLKQKTKKRRLSTNSPPLIITNLSASDSCNSVEITTKSPQVTYKSIGTNTIISHIEQSSQSTGDSRCVLFSFSEYVGLQIDGVKHVFVSAADNNHESVTKLIEEQYNVPQEHIHIISVADFQLLNTFREVSKLFEYQIDQIVRKHVGEQKIIDYNIHNGMLNSEIAEALVPSETLQQVLRSIDGSNKDSAVSSTSECVQPQPNKNDETLLSVNECATSQNSIPPAVSDLTTTQQIESSNSQQLSQNSQNSSQNTIPPPYSQTLPSQNLDRNSPQKMSYSSKRNSQITVSGITPLASKSQQSDLQNSNKNTLISVNGITPLQSVSQKQNFGSKTVDEKELINSPLVSASGKTNVNQSPYFEITDTSNTNLPYSSPPDLISEASNESRLSNTNDFESVIVSRVSETSTPGSDVIFVEHNYSANSILDSFPVKEEPVSDSNENDAIDPLSNVNDSFSSISTKKDMAENINSILTSLKSSESPRDFESSRSTYSRATMHFESIPRDTCFCKFIDEGMKVLCDTCNKRQTTKNSIESVNYVTIKIKTEITDNPDVTSPYFKNEIQTSPRSMTISKRSQELINKKNIDTQHLNLQKKLVPRSSVSEIDIKTEPEKNTLSPCPEFTFSDHMIPDYEAGIENAEVRRKRDNVNNMLILNVNTIGNIKIKPELKKNLPKPAIKSKFRVRPLNELRRNPLPEAVAVNETVAEIKTEPDDSAEFLTPNEFFSDFETRNQSRYTDKK